MSDEFLVHHGIKGQRWGIRRFQNEDGTLTNAGKKRYSAEGYESKKTKKLKKAIENDKETLESLTKYQNTQGLDQYQVGIGKNKVSGSEYAKGLIADTKNSLAKHQDALAKQQKRDAKKAEALEIHENMSTGKRAALAALGGALGPLNYSNYKAAGYSDKEATGKAIVDYWTGANLIAKSTRVRNKAADNS